MTEAQLVITKGDTSYRVVRNGDGDAKISIHKDGQATYQQFIIPAIAVGIIAEFLRKKRSEDDARPLPTT